MKNIIKLNMKELQEIVACIDYTNNTLRMLGKVYREREGEYEHGYLNYLVELRNNIVRAINKETS